VPIQAVRPVSALGAEALHLETTTFEASKGKVTIEPFDVPLDGKGVMKGVVNIAGLDLGQLIAGSSLADKVKVEASSTAACRSRSAPPAPLRRRQGLRHPAPAACRSPARP
jgi:hypothetical protein